MINDDIPLRRTGVQKHCSALMDAHRLVDLVEALLAYLIMALAFLWAAILFKIWGKIDWLSRIISTCSPHLDSGIVVLDILIGLRTDSIGGIWANLLFVNATNLVFSGIMIVLDLTAYY